MAYYDPKDKKYEGQKPQEDPLKGNNFNLTNFNPVRNMPDMNHTVKEEQKPLTQEECDALLKEIFNN